MNYGKDEYEEAKAFGKRLALKHIGWIEDAMSDYKDNATEALATLQSENASLRADLDRTNRDFAALRVAYATDTERLKVFVEQVAESTKRTEYEKSYEVLWELATDAANLLASLAGMREADDGV